jgi:16S rRNA (adenine1518-N6/adenine1519-N6)-dimethyltransferase
MSQSKFTERRPKYNESQRRSENRLQGHQARKRFGQNFLIDQGIIEGIVRAVAAQPGQLVLEIGPGLGALTQRLIEDVQPLHVVELDRDLVARLQKRYAPAQLQVHAGDALAFDFAALAQQLGQPLRLVGNLPYNISSPLLFHLQVARTWVQDQHFMLQKEVVERMVAAPGSKAYGRLSVMLQLDYHMEWLLDVPPTSFDPPPQVDSAVVRMIPHAHPLSQNLDRQRFAQLVSQAFSQRRKVLRNTLGQLLADVDVSHTGLDWQARAEDIALETYIQVCLSWQEALA